MKRVEVVIGDISKRSEQAIVNAANTSLLRGGGVCGAIHLAAGPELELHCRTYNGCPVGEARITPGCDLAASFVIHAVAPRWLDGTRGEAELLRRCYQSIFSLAEEFKITEVAIPAIGTGIYRFPLKQATEIAVAETKAGLERQPLRVVFCCFDPETFEAYVEQCTAAGLI